MVFSLGSKIGPQYALGSMGAGCCQGPARDGGSLDSALATPRTQDYHQAREVARAWALCISRENPTNFEKGMHENESPEI